MSVTVTACPVPSDCALSPWLAGADFYDAYRVPIPPGPVDVLDYTLALFRRTPRWIEALMALRNRLARWVGLKDLGRFDDLGALGPALAGQSNAALIARPLPAGRRVGIFTVIEHRPEELVMGDRDRHLEVRLSIQRQPADESGQCFLTVTTVVHTHHWLGRLYMLPVKPLHQRIAPASLARLHPLPPLSGLSSAT